METMDTGPSTLIFLSMGGRKKMRVREGGEANDNTPPARSGIESRPRGLGDGVRKVSGAGSGTDDTGELVPDLAGVEVDRADEAMEWDSGLRKPSEQANLPALES